MAKFLNVIPIRRNGKVFYRARLTFPFDPELGYKPAPKDFYGKTAAEADKNRRDYKPEKSSVDRETTLLVFVRNHFLADQHKQVQAGHLSHDYYHRRKMQLTRYFLEPEDKRIKDAPLRKIKLGNLKPEHMEVFFRCIANCAIPQEYHHRLKSDFRAVLRMAKHKIPEPVVDYFKDIEVPPLPGRKNLRVLFEPSEIYNKIIDESLPLEDRALIAFPFILNRRPSEAFGLQWPDLDLENGTIFIHRTMKKTSGGSFTLKDGTKTGDKGVRVLPLGEELTSLLRRLKERSSSPFVFVTKRSQKPYNTQNFRKNWPLIKKALGLPDGPTYYSLKHLGNSYALANGVSVEAQAWKMGHTDTEMAQTTYREILGAEKVKTVSVYSQLAQPRKAIN